MNSRIEVAIKSPSNPLFPPACNTLVVDSFNGLPPTYRWSTGVKSEDVPYKELRSGNESISDEQFDDWTTQPTDSFIAKCASETLGLELESPIKSPAVGDKKSTTSATVDKPVNKK